MNWERVSAGHYKSRDGRAEIIRTISKQTYRADDICWSVTIDGKTEVMHEDTLREAKAVAIKLAMKKLISLV